LIRVMVEGEDPARVRALADGIAATVRSATQPVTG
jgi:phosphomannomutase